MTLRTVVRNTRGLMPGDTVARLMPDGTVGLLTFRITEMITGHLTYRDEIHLVYLLDGMNSPFGDKVVKMIVTGNAPWCVSR